MNTYNFVGATLNTEIVGAKNVDVEITESDGTKVKFRAGCFKIESTTTQYVHTENYTHHSVELELITEVQKVGANNPPPQTPPKYFAAMGDAAHAYCDEINDMGECGKFRWEEVWKRMWEVSQRGNPNLKEKGE